MKNSLLLLLLMASARPGPARAQLAAHSGAALYMLEPTRGGTFFAIDLRSGRSTLVPLKLTKDNQPMGLAAHEKGLLVLAETGIWEYDPETKVERKRLAAPPNFSLQQIAHDRKSGVTLVTADSLDEKDLEHEIWALPPGGSELAPVLVRRLAHVDGIDFLPDGRLAIASRGDLWLGTSVDRIEGVDDVLYEMEAVRFCPMGELEAMNGTSSSIGAVQAVAVGNLLAVRISRLGGSGYETFVTVPLPPPGAENLQSRASMIRYLGAVKDLGNGTEGGLLCRDAAGTKAWMAIYPEEGEGTLHCLDSTGKVTKLDFKP